MWVDDFLPNKNLSVVAKPLHVLKEAFNIELEENANSGDVCRYSCKMIDMHEKN